MIKQYGVRKLLMSISVLLLFFSSACLWSETNLSNYLKISIGIAILSFALGITRNFNIRKLVNHRYIVWVAANYAIFEIYGCYFLRIGEFNWDFVLFSGILQIFLTFAFLSLDTKEDVIQTFCAGCKWALLIVCVYMLSKGSVSISNIALGSRIGDELSGNVNTVATNIGLMLFPTVFLTLYNKDRKKFSRITTWGIILLSSLCMLLTGSKKGILVLILIVIFYFIAIKAPIKFLILPIVAVGFIYAVFNVPFLYDTIGFRVIDMFATLGIGTAVTGAQSTAIRNSLIQQGLKSFWNYPIFGGGMNYFQYANHARYYAHNNYVELLNDVGIVGTLIYYVPFINVLSNLIKNIKNRYFNNGDSERILHLFLVFYLLTKFVLDWAMVSFSALCTFTVPFLFVFEVYRRDMYEEIE